MNSQDVQFVTLDLECDDSGCGRDAQYSLSGFSGVERLCERHFAQTEVGR